MLDGQSCPILAPARKGTGDDAKARDELAALGVNVTKNRPIVRRGEGGWERWGGPLWSPA